MVDYALTFARFKVIGLVRDSVVLTNLTQTENKMLPRVGLRPVGLGSSIHCQGIDHYGRAFNAPVTNARTGLNFLLLTHTFSNIQNVGDSRQSQYRGCHINIRALQDQFRRQKQ